MEVLQTSPLGLLGTAPRCSQYSEIGGPCQGAGPNRTEWPILGRSPVRVQQLLEAGKLRGYRVSRDWLRSKNDRPMIPRAEARADSAGFSAGGGSGF